MKKLAERLRELTTYGAILNYHGVDIIREAAKFFDNMPEPPEGYEFTGAYRTAKKGEVFLNSELEPQTAVTGSGSMWPILRPIAPTFPVGSYVVNRGYLDATIYRIIRRADFFKDWDGYADERAIFFMKDPDGKSWKCLPKYRENYEPWLPEKGEEVWVDGKPAGLDWTASGAGTVVNTDDGAWYIRPVTSWRLTGHHSRGSDTLFWTFPLESLAPLAFAPKEEPKPVNKWVELSRSLRHTAALIDDIKIIEPVE